MKKIKKKKTKPRKRWQFCWCDPLDPPANGDAHNWKSKVFRASSFVKAMDKMLEFVRHKPYEVWVDYECAALHKTYDSKKHEEYFHQVDQSEHELAEYVN